MIEERDDLPRVERNVVRLVVLDAKHQVLLLHVRDLGNPMFGTCWELPGGGMEHGETYVDTAVRELREETGLVISTQQIGPPSWRRDVSYTYRGTRWLQHEVIVRAQLHEVAPAAVSSQRVAFENEDLFGFRWWTTQDIIGSKQTFYPRCLPERLPLFLAGEQIEEPEEVWE